MKLYLIVGLNLSGAAQNYYELPKPMGLTMKVKLEENLWLNLVQIL